MNLTTMKQHLITAVFMHEDKIEKEELIYDCKDYQKMIEELLHINSSVALLQF